MPWDPGPHDGHLPRILDEFQPSTGNALDIGCGSGKSLIYLAERGFSGTGIDLSPAALAIAERDSRRRGLMCRWLEGTFPSGFSDEQLPPEAFEFVMERGVKMNKSPQDF